MSSVTSAESLGWLIIQAERERQVLVEGWQPIHDDHHLGGELYTAGRCYLEATDTRSTPPAKWPWSPEWWKPRTRIDNLTRAGALLLAESDRLLRAGHDGASARVFHEAQEIAQGLTRLIVAHLDIPQPRTTSPQEDRP